MRFVVFVSSLLVSVPFLACSSTTVVPAEKTCAGAQAMSAKALVGASLGPKEITLTFDDGPAARTLELSTYLKSRGIRVGFFVNGMNVKGPTETAILAQLVKDGHVIGNHTHTHLSLTNPPPADATIVKEVTDTDTIIAPFVQNGQFMFRAPFGEWDDNAFGVLQASPMKKYIGHIEWDYGGRRSATTAADWACWTKEPQLTIEECSDLYMTEIDGSKNQRGIVLMHDDYVGDGKGAPNSIDMVKLLVPKLEAKGYTFKRVDEVPAIAKLFPSAPTDPPTAPSDPNGATTPDGTAPAASPDCPPR